MYIKRLIIYFTMMFFASLQMQAAQEATQTFSFDGRAYSNATATTPLVDASIQFKIQILNNAQDCILYEETQSKDTSTTNGYFTLQVGSATGAGKRSAGDSGNQMALVYSNTVAVINGKLLADGVTVCPYNPVAGHTRYVRVTMTPSGDGVPRVLSPLIGLDSVPSAVVAERAESIQGLLPSQLLQVNTLTSSLSQANLESLMGATSFARLTSLASVDPSTYIGVTSNFVPGLGNAGAPSIPFSGDSNTGIFSPGADTFAIATNGLERFRVDASGNVGIGTTNPGYKLTVSSGGIFSDYLYTNGTTQMIHNFHGVTPNDATIMWVTTAATAVAPVNMSPRTRYGGSVWDTGTVSAKTVNGTIELMPVSGNPASAYLRMGLDSGAGTYTYPFIFNSAGRFGINTTTPSGDISFGGDVLRNINMERNLTADAAGNDMYITAGGATVLANNKKGGDLYLRSGVATGASSGRVFIQASTGSGAGTGDRAYYGLEIANFGNLALGTTNPQAKLEVLQQTGTSAPPVFINAWW